MDLFVHALSLEDRVATLSWAILQGSWVGWVGLRDLALACSNLVAASRKSSALAGLLDSALLSSTATDSSKLDSEAVLLCRWGIDLACPSPAPIWLREGVLDLEAPLLEA